MIRALQKKTGARMVFGHCRETLLGHRVAPEFYE